MSQQTEFTFKWPTGPKEVILRGNFDDWKGTTILTQNKSGFDITMPMNDKLKDESDKLYFKFIVDGNWTTSDQYRKEHDDHGNENNVICLKDVKPVNVFKPTKSVTSQATMPTPTSVQRKNKSTQNVSPKKAPKKESIQYEMKRMAIVKITDILQLVDPNDRVYVLRNVALAYNISTDKSTDNFKMTRSGPQNKNNVPDPLEIERLKNRINALNRNIGGHASTNNGSIHPEHYYLVQERTKLRAELRRKQTSQEKK